MTEAWMKFGSMVSKSLAYFGWDRHAMSFLTCRVAYSVHINIK